MTLKSRCLKRKILKGDDTPFVGSLGPVLSDKLLSEVAERVVAALSTKSLPVQAQLANINAIGTLR